MRSIKEQREMTIHIEHAELLDWAERARFYLDAYLDDCRLYEGTERLQADILKLLAELPEE